MHLKPVNTLRRPGTATAKAKETAVVSSVEAFEAVDTTGVRFRDYAAQVESKAYAELAAAAESGARRSHRSLSPGALGVALSHVAVAREGLRRAAAAVATNKGPPPTEWPRVNGQSSR